VLSCSPWSGVATSLALSRSAAAIADASATPREAHVLAHQLSHVDQVTGWKMNLIQISRVIGTRGGLR
jgi:hypothetical protein